MRLPRRRGTPLKMTRGAIGRELERAILEAGGVETIRATPESRRQFIAEVESDLLDRADGRTARYVEREITRVVSPEIVEERERMRRRRAQQERREKEKRDREKARLEAIALAEKQAARRASRPACSACGSTDRLLSGGVCVNRTRCGRAASLGWKSDERGAA